MANAWLLQPLPTLGAVSTSGTLQLGAGAYAFTDYAGIVCQMACDAAGNSASIQFDLGADKQIDALLVFGVELFPANGTMTVAWATAAQGNFTGGFSSEAAQPYAGSSPMTSGKGVSIWSRAQAVTARYVRITYTGTGAGQTVRLSRIVINRRIALERNFSFDAVFGVRDLGSLDFARRGVLLRTRGAKLRTVTLTFSSIRRDEMKTMTRPLIEQLGNTDMVALLTDPAEDADRQNCAYYGPLVGDLGHSWARANGFEAKINLVSIF